MTVPSMTMNLAVAKNRQSTAVVVDERGVISPMAQGGPAAEWIFEIDGVDPVVCPTTDLHGLMTRAPDDAGSGWILGLVHARLWLSLVADCEPIKDFAQGAPLRSAYDLSMVRLRRLEPDLMHEIDTDDVLTLTRQELESLFRRSAGPMGRGFISGIVVLRQAVSSITGLIF